MPAPRRSPTPRRVAARRAGLPPAAPFTVAGFVRLAGLTLIYAAVQLVFGLLPLTLPVATGYAVDVRPGVLVPLLVGLLAGPWAGLGVGLLGRLLGDALAGSGPTLAGLAYSGLLGVVMGLAGRRPDDDGRTLRTVGRVALWVLLACVVAAVPVALLPGPASAPPAPFWNRLVTEFLSGAVSALLLLPAGLVLFVRRSPVPRAKS